MRYFVDKLLQKRKIEEYGFFLFLGGIFFLPSALFIAILFLLPASIIGGFLNKKSYFKDFWNYAFNLFGGLILLSATLQYFILIYKHESIWDPMLTIIGMGNWLPFIWLFWAFQPYLNSISKRRSFALILISGSFPVLVTGIGQYFLNWTGPFETLNGLIIWYLKPIEIPGGLSGLFNNQNYAGSWLNYIWPFCVALFLEKKDDILKKSIAFSFLISVGLTAFLTFSRNAWLGLCMALTILLSKKSILFVLSIITLTIFIFSQTFTEDLQNTIKSILPQKIFLEFADEGYEGLDITRIEMFKFGINLIKTNPFFGIGAGAFTPIFFSQTNFWKGHSHNLFIELSLSYGLASSIVFFTTIFAILLLSGIKIFKNKRKSNISIFDKAFWVALFYFMISQMFDIQYFDGKISIIAWILIASLKNIIHDDDGKNKLIY